MCTPPDTRFSLLRSTAEIFSVALLYTFAAWLNSLLIMPPGNIPTFWLPAGLALAAVILGGRRMYIGVLLGAFSITLARHPGAEVLAQSAINGVAAALQAGIGAFLLRRFVGELPPVRIKFVLRAIGLLGLTALLAPALSLTSMYLLGDATWAQAIGMFPDWWIGVYIGMLVFTPGMVVLVKILRRQVVLEPLIWPLSSFIVALALFGFILTWNRENELLEEHLRVDTIEMSRAIQTTVVEHELTLVAVAAFFEGSEKVESAEFSRFVLPLLEQLPSVDSIVWAPRVTDAERPAFEQAMRANGLPDYQIIERTANGQPMPATKRAEYYPATFFEPFAINRAALGFDMASENLRKQMFLRARDTGYPALTAHIRLVRTTDTQQHVLLGVPVYRKDVPINSIMARRENLLGITFNVFQIDHLAEDALSKISGHDIELYLFDVSEAQPQFMLFSPSFSGAQSLDGALPADPASLETWPFFTTRFNVYGRTWQIVARPGPAYFAETRSWNPWINLLIGLVSAVIFMLYMESRQRADARLREAEHQYRTLVEYSPAIVYLDEVGEDWRYISPKIETILGYTADDFLQNRKMWQDCIDPQDRPQVMQRTQATLIEGGRLDLEYRMLTSTGKMIWIRDEAEVIREPSSGAWLLRGVMYDITERKRIEIERQSLLEIMQGLATSPDPHVFLQLVHRSLAQVLYAENFFVLLYNQQTEQFEQLYLVDKHNTTLPNGHLSHSLTAYVFRTAEPLIATQEMCDSLTARGDVEIMSSPLPSWLGAPLKIEARCIGVIAVQDYDVVDRYTERDKAFLNSVAAQIALAIERQQAEETLLQRDAQYSLITEHTADVIWIFDLESDNFTYVSPSAEKLYGYTAQEILDLGIECLLTPDSLRKIQSLMHERSPASEILTYVDELEQIRKDGSLFPAEVTTSFAIDESGKVQIVGVTRDISARKQMDALLQQSQNSLEMAQAISHLGSWDLDLHTGSGFWSQEMYRIWHRDPSAGVPSLDEFLQLIHPDDRAMVLETQHRVAETGQLATIEYRAIPVPGELRIVEATLYPIQDAQGHFVRMAGTVLDVTERKRVEERLRKLNRTYVVLSEVNETIVRVHAQQELFEAACRIAVGRGGFRMAWVGLIDPYTKRVQPVASAGEVGNYLDKLNIMLDDSPRGHGPVATALRTGRHVVVNDVQLDPMMVPWRADAIRLGYQSTAAFPLMAGGYVRGALNLYAQESDFFDEAELKLFDEMALDISFALDFITQEQQRKQAEERLRASERRGQVLLNAIPDLMFRLTRDGIILDYSAPDTNKLYVSPTAFIGNDMADFMPQDVIDMHRDAVQHAFETGQTQTIEYQLVMDGKICTYEARLSINASENEVVSIVRDITETRYAIEQIRQLSRVVEQTDDSVMITDVHGMIEYVNPAFEHHLGYTSTEVLGKTPSFLKSGKHSREFYQHLWVTILHGESFQAEFQNRRKDGQLMYEDKTITPIRDDHGTITRFVATGKDITTRKQAELALLEAQALYQTVFDVSLDGLAIFDDQYNVMLCNRRGAEMGGYARPEDLRGLSISDLVAPEDRKRVLREAMHQLRAGVAHGEYLAQRRDGTTFPAEYALVRLPPNEGQLAGLLVGVTRDITARKREMAIQSTQFAVTRLLIASQSFDEAAPVLLQTLATGLGWHVAELWLDDGTNHLRWNADWNEPRPELDAFSTESRTFVFDYGVGMIGRMAVEKRSIWFEDLGKADLPRSPLAQRTGVRAAVAFPVLSEESLNGVIALYHLESRQPEEDLMLALDSVSRQIGLFVARRQAEASLADERNSLARRVADRTSDLSRANTELARAVRAKDEFLANMSHELRTPLNAILALSESLLEQVRGPLNERQQASLRNIETSGRHLLALINDILDLSKVEAGRMDLQLENIPISDLCESSLMFIKEQASKKQIQIAFQLNDQMAKVKADPKRMKQMLVNLLTNAVKFTEKGGNVSLQVDVDPVEGVVYFAVQDTGIGMSHEGMTQLFQPFTQLDSSLNRQHEGTGLGLALVRRLAELHGGSIRVDSERGKGSRFTIALPYTPREQSSNQYQDTDLLPDIPGGLPFHSALVIDDSETTAEQLARYLQGMDISAAIHPYGTGVLEHTFELNPDIIFLDLQMPRHSGWEILAQLKADPRTHHIPVVIASVVDDRVSGLSAGAAEYLVKPVSRDVLRKLLLTVARGLESPEPPVAPARPGLHQHNKRARVLLAEDNEVNIMAIGDYLEDKGFDLVVARNGREAIEQAIEQHPDVILMDIQMPEMDGLEAIRQLRARPEFVSKPIIALTALAMPGDRERCLAVGANEYMTKPVSLKGLVEMIQHLL